MSIPRAVLDFKNYALKFVKEIFYSNILLSYQIYCNMNVTKYFYFSIWYQTTKYGRIEILNHLPTVMFRGTPFILSL